MAIVNRGAGTVRSGEISAEGLRRSFLEVGTEADVHLIPGDEIAAAAREAAASGADAVLAGGGDGTIRTVAAALVGGQIPLGVLPLGTLNHFARDLGIPTEIEEAIRLIPRGEARSLDVGEVNGEIFINNSMLGLYPPMVRVRDWQRHRLSRGKLRATVSALFKVLPKLPSLHVKLTADGLSLDRRTRFVFVGNNEYELNAFTYGARERFDSGFLYLYIAKSQTRLGLVADALLGLFRDMKRTDRFDRWRLPDFTVETHHNKKAVPVYLDGEVLVMTPPLRYRTRALCLKVIVPPAGG